MKDTCFGKISGNLFHRMIMFFTILFFLLSGTVFCEETAPRKVVRIPCINLNRFMILDKNKHPVSGYAYDYIQMISTYAGWDVKYIPCDNFSDCLNKFLAGEFDLFYDISYTEERAKEILFPDEPMGTEFYYLYTTNKNTSIAPDDYKSMNGKKVGVTIGTIQIEFLKRWCEKKKVQFELVEFKSMSDKDAAMYTGKIDLNLEVSMQAKRDFSAVEKIGSSAYYLVANKNRPDLIKNINSAMEKILSNDLYYFSRLQEQYFADTVLSRNLTTEEKRWIKKHKVLRVGYFDNYLPFCAKNKKGEPIGAAVEAIREIVRQLDLEDKLKVEFICYDSQQKGYKAVESGEIDLMFPAYISNSIKLDYRIIGGKIFAALSSDLAYIHNYGNGIGKRIGVNINNLMQYYYTKDSYPHSEVVFYNSIQECLDGVLDGTSDGTLLNSFRTEALLKPHKYREIKAVRYPKGFEFRMAFAKDNIGLLLLMDRGLTMLGPGFFDRASYSYAGQINAYTLMDYLRDHILQAIITVAIIAAMIVALIVYQISNRKLAGINRELKDYSETIEKQRQEETELREQLERQQIELGKTLQLAQAANRAKTTFLSNMSHDIRTPMNAIIGFTGLAASHIDDKERVQEYLTTIAHSSEHLLSLINDVLEMSRIESGKIILNEKPESLADILHVIRDIVNADIQAKQHNFFIDAANVRNERVCCDKVRLNQVLLNLISNAIKYTPPGGTISLRIIQKSVSDTGYGTYEFRCKDNGIGISKEFAETIFDPFTREANSTVSGIQGTGLGMAITKNIVDMMGGTITVNSTKGEGTEFIVTVDLKIADNKVSDPAIPELKGLRSLVVDDDINTCQSISDMLRDTGMQSEWCTSGREAVIRTEEALRHGDLFKIYIIDWLMPDMNGLETVRRIRKLAGKEPTILILTAYDWFEIEREAKEAGVSGFLSKPLFPSDLKRTLANSCEKTTPDQTERKEKDISFKGKKILMVDDSKVNLKIGTLLLQEQGMIVDTASNGQMAVDRIREKGVNAYDFVLMDIQMPVMDGYEATTLIRKLPDGDKLKILAFSANAFEEDREKSLKVGMNGHIAKPLKIDELLNELKRFCV